MFPSYFPLHVNTETICSSASAAAAAAQRTSYVSAVMSDDDMATFMTPVESEGAEVIGAFAIILVAAELALIFLLDASHLQRAVAMFVNRNCRKFAAIKKRRRKGRHYKRMHSGRVSPLSLEEVSVRWEEELCKVRCRTPRQRDSFYDSTRRSRSVD